MTSLPSLLAQGTAHAWLFVPSAILLGALHGLEPGHSKTMMAAFIIAVRGTVGQAVLLGLSAAISHTAVVWLVALGGQYLGRNFKAEAIEAYLQIASALIVAGIALWMVWRTWRESRAEHDHHHHDHGEVRRIDTGHGWLTLLIHEDGVPPRFRISFDGHGWAPGDVSLVTERPDGARQEFRFERRDGFLESTDMISEPHTFVARLSLGHGGHTHDYTLTFAEHDHDHAHMNLGDEDDAHARAHADDIRRRFTGQSVTTGQIVGFGLTGGLIPCPAAITVLLLCLQLRELTLGAVLVLSFSVGLAITMVSAGVLASLSIRHVQKRWSGFSAFARRAPYASAALMLLVAVYMGIVGWSGLHHEGARNTASAVHDMG